MKTVAFRMKSEYIQEKDVERWVVLFISEKEELQGALEIDYKPKDPTTAPTVTIQGFGDSITSVGIGANELFDLYKTQAESKCFEISMVQEGYVPSIVCNEIDYFNKTRLK